MTNKSKRGPKSGQTTIKQLTVLLAALAQSNEPIQAQSAAAKLNISYEEAQRLMDMLVDVAGDEASYLPLAFGENDDELEFISPTTSIKPLRLTKAESIALLVALQTSGFKSSDPLFQIIQNSYIQPTIDTQEITRTVVNTSILGSSTVLLDCIRALINNQQLEFVYVSQHSNTTKLRLVHPLSLYVQDGYAYLKAYEYTSKQLRTFRLDRMSEIHNIKTPKLHEQGNEAGEKTIPISQQDCRMIANQTEANSANSVAITLLDPSLEETYPWHAIKRTQLINKNIQLIIPNYGSSWLIRHLAACGDQVQIEDPQLAKKVSDYAQDLLNDLASTP
ncbi:helix-turn-helix transcriptional regulator [Atopobium fossor]|uniref:helix-turn-helix transcriptional regulator n=1 Tax=Atopobium fossor TaxID=39487 RepID=UPI0003F80FF9|nr:WYL domain-containing protein [Atopobium fossor]